MLRKGNNPKHWKIWISFSFCFVTINQSHAKQQRVADLQQEWFENTWKMIFVGPHGTSKHRTQSNGSDFVCWSDSFVTCWLISDGGSLLCMFVDSEFVSTGTADFIVGVDEKLWVWFKLFQNWDSFFSSQSMTSNSGKTFVCQLLLSFDEAWSQRVVVQQWQQNEAITKNPSTHEQFWSQTRKWWATDQSIKPHCNKLRIVSSPQLNQGGPFVQIEGACQQMSNRFIKGQINFDKSFQALWASDFWNAAHCLILVWCWLVVVCHDECHQLQRTMSWKQCVLTKEWLSCKQSTNKPVS